MLTKVERFQRFRGKQAITETKYITLAERMSQFVDETVDTSEIEMAFLSSPPKYQEWDRAGLTSTVGWSAILMCGLLFDSVVDELPISATEEERTALAAIKNLLYLSYDQGLKSKEKATNFFRKCDEFLAVDIDQFSDKQIVRKLYIALYALLFLGKIKLSHLGLGGRGLLSVAQVSRSFILHKLDELLLKVKTKIAEIDSYPVLNTPNSPADKTTLQTYVNARYLKLLKQNEGNPKRVRHLIADMEKINEGAKKLIKLQEGKKEAIAKREKIQSLVYALGMADQKIMLKANFLNLIAMHEKAYHHILEGMRGEMTKQLSIDIAQLREANDVQQITSRISDVLSKVPTKIQNIFPWMLVTRSKECLKNLAHEYFPKLQEQITKIKSEISSIKRTHFELTEPNSENDIEQEDIEGILATNKALLPLLIKYEQLSKDLHTKRVFLRKIQHTELELAEFIRINDGFLVWLSNFFAQFYSYFKSDTATLVDKAKEMEHILHDYEESYQNEINAQLRHIRETEVPRALKSELMKEFGRIPIPQGVRVLDAQNIRYLSTNFSYLFAVPSQELVADEVEELATIELNSI